jgi:hypothetical protein
MTFALKIETQQRLDVRFVLNDQDAWHNLGVTLWDDRKKGDRQKKAITRRGSAHDDDGH